MDECMEESRQSRYVVRSQGEVETRRSGVRGLMDLCHVLDPDLDRPHVQRCAVD